jgi:MFS family permease
MSPPSFSANKSSDADRNWRVFLWFRVLFSARFYYPVLAVLFLDLGLSATEYTLLNVAWAAASLLSDVPAGVLADRIGRKPLLVAAGSCMVAEMAILCLAPRNGGVILFLFCLANRILSGLAEGLASGADEAIVYDTLAENGRESEWHRVLEQVTKWQSAGFVIAMLVGGAVYAPGFMNGILAGIGIHARLDQSLTLRFPILLTLASAVAVLLLALSFREPHRRLPHALEDAEGHHASSVTGAFSFVIHAGRWLLGNPLALFVVCAGFVLESCVRLFLTFSSSYFRLIDIPEIAFGALGAAMGGIGFFVSPLARRMVNRRSIGGSFAIIAGLVLAGLAGIAAHPPHWGILFGFLLGAAMTMIGFCVSTYLNTLVDSHHRATVLSFKGVAFNFAYGGISLLFALALHKAPGADAQQRLANAFGLLPLCLLLTCVILLLVFRKHLVRITARVTPPGE